MTISECRTLAEYRQWVLRLSQQQVAVLAGCRQAWISQIERGHLPQPFRDGWNRILRAYHLERHENEFIRLVKAAAKGLSR